MTKEKYNMIFDGLVIILRWFMCLFCIFKLIRLNKFWAGLAALFFINSWDDINQELSDVGRWMYKENSKYFVKDETKKDSNTIKFGFVVDK